MEFLCRSTAGDGSPLVAFGGSDGVIRVLSMITWKVWGLFAWHVAMIVACCCFGNFFFLPACEKIHWRSQRIHCLLDDLYGFLW